MNWKNYSHLSGSHAFLSASRYHWINYSEEKLIESYLARERITIGTKLHKVAEELIELGIRLPDTTATLNSFVNDGIGYKMTPEVVLYFSPNAYGTADCIGYHNGVLRIHDLKTGQVPGSITQVMIYAALFLLDYKEKPKEIFLRVYQNDEITEYEPPLGEVEEIADRIVGFDKLIDAVNQQAIL